MGRTALGGESDGSAESRAGLPAGEVSEQLKNGKPFLLRGVSDIEAPGADAFFVPVRSRDRQGGLCGIGSVISIWCMIG